MTVTNEDNANRYLENHSKNDLSDILGYSSIEVKVGLSPSKKICFVCFAESLLKIMKNGFYLILKAAFVLTMFKFLSRLFDHAEKRLD